MKFVKRKEYGLASRLKKSAVSYAMMAPYMIVFILLTVIPVIAAICLSFTYFNMLEPPKFTGLLNYERLFLDDEIFPQVLKNTLVFAIITGPLSYLISFVSAWLINEMGRAVRTVMTFCLVSLDVEINPRFYRGIVKRAELQQKWRGECQAERL